MAKNRPENKAHSHYVEHLTGVGVSKGMKSNPAVSLENDMVNMLFRELTELCMNRFKWEGLPDSVDVRFLEKTLMKNALAVFYWESKYDKFLALPASYGALDYQDNPIQYRIQTHNGFINRTLNAQQCVPIWANYSRVNDMDIVQIYATRLARLDRTIDINLNNARQTKVIHATPETQLSVENFNRQLEEGQPVIRTRADLTENVSVLDLGVDPNLFEKVSLARTRIWNECMGLLGIKHANQDKKERLVSDEVAANDEQISYMKAVHLNARKIAADQINRKYGLSVSVEYDDDIKPKEPVTGVRPPTELTERYGGETPDESIERFE